MNRQEIAIAIQDHKEEMKILMILAREASEKGILPGGYKPETPEDWSADFKKSHDEMQMELHGMQKLAKALGYTEG